jgi:hypothetical protein
MLLCRCAAAKLDGQDEHQEDDLRSLHDALARCTRRALLDDVCFDHRRLRLDTFLSSVRNFYCGWIRGSTQRIETNQRTGRENELDNRERFVVGRRFGARDNGNKESECPRLRINTSIQPLRVVFLFRCIH